jgi:hypothetical protein
LLYVSVFKGKCNKMASPPRTEALQIEVSMRQVL